MVHVDHKDAQDNWRNLAEIHAAQSGMDLKAYAEASGKVYKSLYNKVTSYRVSSVSHVGNADAQDNWRNLAEIHAAPNWLWKALVAEMLDTPRARGREVVHPD